VNCCFLGSRDRAAKTRERAIMMYGHKFLPPLLAQRVLINWVWALEPAS